MASISRRPVGHQAVGQTVGSPPPQQAPFQGPSISAMYAPPSYGPGQTMMASGQATPSQTAPYQAGPYYAPIATRPMPGQAPPTQANAQIQTHWPAATTTYQGPPQSATPSQMPAYTPGQPQVSASYPSQSPRPPMAHAAQVRASISRPPPQMSPHPSQMSSPAPTLQNSPNPNVTNLASPPQMIQGQAPNFNNAQLHRTTTANSAHSLTNDFDRRLSLSSNISIGTPSTTISTPEQTLQNASTPDGPARACDSCKNAIPSNLSVFTCLVCSTANISTHICVWCFTTGAAASTHPHDTSYLATDSDLRVQERVGYILPSQWTIRKNASGRLWYTYNETGYRTHIQPLTGVVYDMDVDVGLPHGWQQMKSPEGKAYFYNQSTGASSWTKPRNAVPPGWKVYKTPDGVLFYVHEVMKLSTWDRPGAPPRAAPGSAPTPGSRKASQSLSSGPATPAGSTNRMSRIGNALTNPDKLTKATNNMAMAANVTNNIAKLSAASDMSPDGILKAGIAAAKLTGMGLRVAGKKVGNMGKRKNMYAAANFIGAAATITGALDGDTDPAYFQVEEVDEVDVTVDTQATDQVSIDQTSYFPPPSDPSFFMTQQSAIEQPAFVAPQDQSFTGQQTSYFSDQVSYGYDQNTGMQPDQIQQQLADQIQQQLMPQDPSMMTSDVNITVQETIVSNGNVQEMQFTENILYSDGPQGPQFTETQTYTDTTQNNQFGESQGYVETAQNGQFTGNNGYVDSTQVTQFTENSGYVESAQVTQVTETNVSVETAQAAQTNQYATQDAVITNFADLSWADPPSLSQGVDAFTPAEPQNIETPAQQLPVSQFIETSAQQSAIDQQTQFIQQAQASEQASIVQQPQIIEQPAFFPPLETEQPQGMQQPAGQPQGVQQTLGYPQGTPEPESQGHHQETQQPHNIQQPQANYSPEITSPPPHMAPQSAHPPSFHGKRTLSPIVSEIVPEAPLATKPPPEQCGVVMEPDTAALI